MGRKIPAKKHRGVKDPLEQQARRLQSLKSKINAPPKDPDEQPVPRSLTRLFEFQNKISNNQKHKQKNGPKHLNKFIKDNHSEKRIRDNPISRLRKLPGETGRDFSLRINSAIKALHSPMEQLEYPQDMMEEEDEKGARMAGHRERRARKRRRAQKDAARDGAEPRHAQPSRARRLALKNNQKKLKALETQQERREVQYERVPFGDVCSAPPALAHNARLAARTGRAPADGAQRPGRRELLLTGLLSGGAAPRAAPPSAPRAAAGDALRREQARLHAVAAYRHLKAQRHAAARPTPHT